MTTLTIFSYEKFKTAIAWRNRGTRQISSVKIMAECWKADPKERPTFSGMEEIIVGQLESSVTSSYLNMNDQYAKINEEVENAAPTDLFGLAKLLNEKSHKGR